MNEQGKAYRLTDKQRLYLAHAEANKREALIEAGNEIGAQNHDAIVIALSRPVRTAQELASMVWGRVQTAHKRYHYSDSELLQAMGKHLAEIVAEMGLTIDKESADA